MKNDIILTLQMITVVLILTLGFILANISSDLQTLTAKPATPKVETIKVVEVDNCSNIDYTIPQDLVEAAKVCLKQADSYPIHVNYIYDGLSIICKGGYSAGSYNYPNRCLNK